MEVEDRRRWDRVGRGRLRDMEMEGEGGANMEEGWSERGRRWESGDVGIGRERRYYSEMQGL